MGVNVGKEGAKKDIKYDKTRKNSGCRYCEKTPNGNNLAKLNDAKCTLSPSIFKHRAIDK